MTGLPDYGHPDYDYYADNHICRRCGERLGDNHSCDATEYEEEPAPRIHDTRCVYCEHGPYCLVCPAPDLIPDDDAHVCGPCREAITRGEIAADPYYQGKDLL